MECYDGTCQVEVSSECNKDMGKHCKEEKQYGWTQSLEGIEIVVGDSILCPHTSQLQGYQNNIGLLAVHNEDEKECKRDYCFAVEEKGA